MLLNMLERSIKNFIWIRDAKYKAHYYDLKENLCPYGGRGFWGDVVEQCGRRSAKCGILRREAFIDILVLVSGKPPWATGNCFLDRINGIIRIAEVRAGRAAPPGLGSGFWGGRQASSSLVKP